MRQILRLALSAAAAIATAYCVVIFFGDGLGGPPSMQVESFARVENVRLPVRARAGKHLKSFVIRLRGDVDDFARVYVNNREVTSNHNHESPFRHITWREKDEHDEYVLRFAVDRASPIEAEVEVRRWLRNGVNWIMVELENTRWGACSMTVELQANGAQLEGSPYFIPQRERVEGDLTNPHLTERLRRLARQTNSLGAFAILPEGDALCARLVLAFQLS